MALLRWDALVHREKQAAPEVQLVVCPASADTRHRELSQCHQVSPPPPDLGLT